MIRLTTLITAMALSVSVAHAEPSSLVAFDLETLKLLRNADPARGQEIAEKWCASCHQIAPGAMSFDESRPATFQEIADHPVIDESTLKTFFETAHYQMPNFSVTDEVRDHLIPYIMSPKHQ